MDCIYKGYKVRLDDKGAYLKHGNQGYEVFVPGEWTIDDLEEILAKDDEYTNEIDAAFAELTDEDLAEIKAGGYPFERRPEEKKLKLNDWFKSRYGFDI